jgi:hypothetical protein
MTPKQANILQNILDTIEVFEKHCEQIEYTNTDTVWALFEAIKAGIETVQQEN